MTLPPVPAGSIVVGVDGSASSNLAIDWAAAQAGLEGRPLVVAHSCRLTVGGDAFWPIQTGFEMGEMAEAIRVAGHGLLDNARRRARRQVSDLEIVSCLGPETGARHLLVELADRASSLVVGSRGRGPAGSVLLGSVSVALARHATCPVVVVRHMRDTPVRGGVVVEAPDGDAGRAAMDLACCTASLRGWPVTVVRAVRDLGSREAPRVLALAAADARAAYPDLTVRTRVTAGARTHELVRASRDADLLVLGTRRSRTPQDLLHRSGAVTVVEHAACDVAVVPDVGTRP